ncbi:hypothetical protein DER45DRAFT_627280 [Fusarium avenaceum]|nr:hypothetical protein DER45DRAFT_627280 [Fusarium avenaceum]
MPFFRSSEEIIPIADVVNQIIEAAGIGFVVIQMPLYTYVNLGLPSQPGELPVLQPSQFLPVHLAKAVSIRYDICSNATNSDGLHFRKAFDEWDEKHYKYFGSDLVSIAAGFSYDWSFKEPFMNHTASPILYMAEEINAIATYLQFVSEPDPRNQLTTIQAMSDVAEALSWTRHHVIRLGKRALILKQWVEPVIEAATQVIQPLEECAAHVAKTNKSLAAIPQRTAIHTKHLLEIYKFGLSKTHEAGNLSESLASKLVTKCPRKLGMSKGKKIISSEDKYTVILELSKVYRKVHQIAERRDEMMLQYKRSARERENVDYKVSCDLLPCNNYLGIRGVP